MKNRFSLSILATLLVASFLGLFASGANAAVQDTACYKTTEVTELSHQEYRYSKTVTTPKFKTQHEVDKFVRTREKRNGQWGSYSTPVRYVPIGSHDEFVNVVAPPNWQAHSEGTTNGIRWERQWALMATGVTRQVADGNTVTTEYFPSVDGWTNEGPTKAGWTKIAERKVIDREAGTTTTEFPCPGAAATPGTCEGPGTVSLSPETSQYFTWNVDRTNLSAVTATVTPGPGVTINGSKSFGPWNISQITGSICIPDGNPATPTATRLGECGVSDRVTVIRSTGVNYFVSIDGAAATPVVFGESTSKVFTSTAKSFSVVVTATAAEGYELVGYPQGGWSFTALDGSGNACLTKAAVVASVTATCASDAVLKVTNNGETAATIVGPGSKVTILGGGKSFEVTLLAVGSGVHALGPITVDGEVLVVTKPAGATINAFGDVVTDSSTCTTTTTTPPTTTTAPPAAKVAPPADPTPESLAFTGLDASGLVLIALVAIALGGGSMIIVRRRKTV